MFTSQVSFCVTELGQFSHHRTESACWTEIASGHMKSRQGLFIILCSRGVKATSPICSRSRFVRKGLCIMDTLSSSAQMRILILATGSRAMVGERARERRRPLGSNCFRRHPCCSWDATTFLQLWGDCPLFCMTPPMTCEGYMPPLGRGAQWCDLGQGMRPRSLPLREWQALLGLF